jgi:hypothetical protein
MLSLDPFPMSVIPISANVYVVYMCSVKTPDTLCPAGTSDTPPQVDFRTGESPTPLQLPCSGLPIIQPIIQRAADNTFQSVVLFH